MTIDNDVLSLLSDGELLKKEVYWTKYHINRNESMLVAVKLEQIRRLLEKVINQSV